MTRLRYGMVLLGLALALLTAPPARGQAPVRLRIESTAVTEHSTALQLTTTFSLPDQTGLPARDTVVEGAFYVLADGRQVPASLTPPRFYVALLVDASGSMRGALPALRDQATALAALAPPDAAIGLFRFGDYIQTRQPYATDRADLVTALASLDDGEAEGTCLYDAVYRAVQSLQQVAGTGVGRVLILYSDGRDERTVGANDTCSSRAVEDIVMLVGDRARPVSLHTVGLRGSALPLDVEALTALANAGGGLALTEPLRDAPALLAEQLLPLAGRWRADAMLQTAAGEQSATLFVRLADQNAPHPVNIPFTASRDFRPPQFDATLRYDAAADRLLLNFNARAAVPIALIEAIVTDDEDTLIPLDLEPRASSIELAEMDLTTGRRYTVDLQLRDDEGNLVLDAAGLPLSSRYAFTYDAPEPLQLDIETAVHDSATNELVLTLQVVNTEQLARYTGYLKQPDSEQRENSFELPPSAGTTLRVPLTVAPGDYVAVVSGRDANGRLLQSAARPFSFEPPPQPSRLLQTWFTLRANPALLTLITVLSGVILLLGILLLVTTTRDRQLRPPAQVQES